MKKRQKLWKKAAAVLVCSLSITSIWGVGQASAYSSSVANRIIDDGVDYYGTPYVFGSSSYTTRTFDCSSFVQRVYYENGIMLPRNSRQQSREGRYVPVSQLKKGDLIFFDTKPDGVIDHVAIFAGKYKGSYRLLHTYKEGIGVTVSTITPNNYWGKTYVTSRRVIE